MCGPGADHTIRQWTYFESCKKCCIWIFRDMSSIIRTFLHLNQREIGNQNQHTAPESKVCIDTISTNTLIARNVKIAWSSAVTMTTTFKTHSSQYRSCRAFMTVPESCSLKVCFSWCQMTTLNNLAKRFLQLRIAMGRGFHRLSLPKVDIHANRLFLHQDF